VEFSKYLNTLETRQRTRATFQHFDILEFVLHLMTCRCVRAPMHMYVFVFVCVRCQPPWAIKRNNKAYEAYFTHVFVAFITISKRAADCWHATPPSKQQHHHHLEPPTIPIIFGPATKYLSKHVAFGATFIAFLVSYSQREEHFFANCLQKCLPRSRHLAPSSLLPLLLLPVFPNVAKFLITWSFSCTGE